MITNDNNSLFSVQPAINASTGDLTYTLASNANGIATVTVNLSDNGGGTDHSADQTFTITVTAVNGTPSFTKGSDQTVLEDAGAQTVNGWATSISDGDPELTQVLTFNIISNNNTSLFTVQPAINSSTGDLTYTPALNANGTATVTVNLSDDGGAADHSADQTFTITVIAVNDAPILSDLSYTLASITEDQADNAGTLVSSIIASGGGDPVTDVDAGASEGIAITSVDNTHGTWEYTTDGTTWSSIGSATASSARLLYSDGITRLRFNPLLSYNNAQALVITFRAWDRTGSGLENGGTADITALGTGGITPFSTLSDAAIISVTAVNDAPVLDDAANYTLTTITEDEGNNTGTLVSAIISSGGGNPITDFDIGAIEGIAVISSVDNGHGTWEYTTNGTNWLALGSVSDASARVLSDNSNTRLRFNPELSYNMGQTATITFRAWDQLGGISNGSIADITLIGTGGTTAFSTASDNASITVTSLNDAPVITEGETTTVTCSEDNSPTAFSLTLNATDVENDDLTWSITTQPQHTELATASGTGTSKAIGYTPTANYNGSDSFVVTVSDGNGGTDNITVNVTINAVNDGPQNSVPAGQTIAEGGTLVFSVCKQ